MSEPSRTIPFCPHLICERRGHVTVWWFRSDFSQARLGGKITGGSNACTIIVLLIAQKCYLNAVKVHVSPEDGVLSQDVINVLGESIMQGNDIHKRLAGTGALSHLNLTVPEAIQAAGPGMKFLSEWKSFVYLCDLRETLFEKLSESVQEWYRNPPPQRGSDLFVVLIAETRSVIFVFNSTSQIKTVTLIDSHSHKNYGAVVSTCAFQDLSDLCSWYCDVMETCYNAQPSCYELNFLYFKKLDSGEGSHNK